MIELQLYFKVLYMFEYSWGFLFVFLFLIFRDRVSLCISGCPGTHFVDQAGLELRNLPASASRALGLKGCTTTAWLLKPLYAYVFKLPFCLSLFFANPLPPRKPCQSITGVTVWFSSCQWREGMPWLQSNKISGGRYGNCFLLENSNLNNNQKQKTRKVLIKYLFFLFLYFWQTSCHLTWVYMSEL